MTATTIVFNTKTNKVAFRFDRKPTNDELTAACGSIPNGFADELQNLKLAELVNIFNANSGADVDDIKKFRNKTTAVSRVTEILVDIPVYDGKAAPAVSTTSLAEGVAKSWTVPEVRAARSQRHGVRVGKEEFSSILKAYAHFKLDLKFHRDHRLALKAAMPKGVKDSKGRMWTAFEK